MQIMMLNPNISEKYLSFLPDLLVVMLGNLYTKISTIQNVSQK